MTAAQNLRVPELVAGVDVRTLPLSALEGFVLSRIDGKSSTTDIVALTGLPSEQVVAILDKLLGLGAVRYRDAGVSSDASAPVQRRSPEAGPQPPPGRRVRASHGPGHQPRRVFSESAISSPPPELPQQSARPRSPSDWGGSPGSRTHSLPPSQARPPSGQPSTAPSGQRSPASGTAEPMSPPSAAPTAAAAERPRTEASFPGARASQPSAISGAAFSSTMGPIAGGALPGVSIAPSAVPEPAVYDVRELDEDVDLPRERRKQVLDLYYRLSEIDYYEALGVAYNADKKEIRAAYFGLSKLLHPDSMFRKNLGSFKHKMEAVFNYLTEGYETLGKKKNRDEYDTYLRATKAARMAERALSFEPNVPLPSGAVHVPPLPPLPVITETAASQSSEPPPLPPREASAEARKLAQEVIGRRLRGAVSPSTRHPAPLRATPAAPARGAGASPPAASPAARSGGEDLSFTPPKTDTQDLLRRLTRTLRDAGQLTGSNDRVTRALRASQAAVARGDLGEATQQAARAASLAPERGELKAEHARLSVMLSERLADDYIEQAKFEMKHGKWASAALSWAKVCEGRPNDALAHRQAGQSLLKAGGELRGAQKYAQKAIFLAPSDIESRILLAQIYLTVGLKLNARRELDAAAKLDPANEMVKNLLADLEKG